MNSIKTVQKDLPNLKQFLNENSLDTLTQFFTNFINFHNVKDNLVIILELIKKMKLNDEKSV
jgi:hypothetical protein